MAVRRMALSASWLAVCLALPAFADEQIDLPLLPEPADVVILSSDLLPELDYAALLPPLPEAPPIVIDLAGNEGSIAEPRKTAPPSALDDERQVTVSLPAHEETVPDPTMTTAALVPSEPVLADVPAVAEIVVRMPEPPEEVPVFLGDIVLPKLADAPPSAAPAIDRVSAAELATLLATALPGAVRHAWLPESEERQIVAFYEARQYRPLWTDVDGLSVSGKSLVAMLARASDDGLRAADYALPRLILPRPADLAAQDIRLTALAVRYARDARGARIDPRRLSALITPKLNLPTASDVLAKLSSEGVDAGEILASYQPQHAGYQALRRKLVELKSERKAADPATMPQVRIPNGPAVRIGMRDDRILLVRARFGFAPDDNRMHDRQLATVIAGFQKENGLPNNGVLNRATIDAMNGGRIATVEADLIATMERWRWLPVELGDEHLIVNVPEYMMRKIEAGQVVHSSRVVVGKSERPTPIFSDLMDHLVMNPSWTIPPTIMREDILPKLATDPGYAERRGFQVIRRGNQISVRQPPGPTNALGNVKFMFPNDHAVYLHDTPSRGLFANSRRAYSSGCVRVEQPLKLAELVLGGPENGWSERRLQGMVGSGERTIRLTRKLPIHIVYMTHVVDATGELKTYDDIYGFHRRTREALGL